ncbi:MAG: hypothetical protein JWP59_442 [Massilia sp.]|jgi:type IV secretory pathway VirB10-like protein|nr:hypothetical protein [Massilia sp.]
MNLANFYRSSIGVLLLCCASLAQAQYMWIDAKGIKQYSDRPPPPSVPIKDIKKAPKGQPSAENMPVVETAAATAAAAPAAATPNLPPSLAEREADYVKRQKAKLEQEKKEREEKEQKSAQRDFCEHARAAKASLDSGVRLGITNKNGERGFMDDAQRAAESKKVEKALAGCPAG